MTEKIKNGLCIFALLLALLAAYMQEVSFQRGDSIGTSVQPGPFLVAQVK